ncbi:MAG: type II toxin-antitoxin system HipA family toxin [Actinomycetota bacterium]|nr:type II toxin-antitoxin system HipA family toxin [Actinomycetota bacterium]
MIASLVVQLGDVTIGRLERPSHGRLAFEYEDSYREDPGRTPLSLSMPVDVKRHADQVITPWLWGLLPDNDAVLRRWAREFHVSASSAFSILSTPVGHDCAGAVRFLNEETGRSPEGQAGVTWLTDEEVGEKLRELRSDKTSWLGQGFTGQFSLAGAQAKTALLLENGRWGIPYGDIPTTHILKPAIDGIDDHDLNEHLCLDAAGRAGLISARSSITDFDGQTAVVVERYDRVPRPDGRIRRIHQEDLCQALRVHPRDKYQNEGGPTPSEIANLFRDSMPPQASLESVWRFAESLAWNWIIGGTDAHAKNYSLLLAGPDVRLAPLYDVASALPYGVHEKKLRLAMKIGTSYEVFPRRNTWPGAARTLGLDPDELIAKVTELTEAAPDAFADSANHPDVEGLGRELPAKLVDLVAERSKRCLELLAG